MLNIYSLPLIIIFRHYYLLYKAKKSKNLPSGNLFPFPSHIKKVGWVLLIPSGIMLVLVIFSLVEFTFLNTKIFVIYDPGFFSPKTIFGFVKTNISFQLFGILYLVGVVLVAFSKEKFEDEHIVKIRLESMSWAMFLNYYTMIFCFLFFWGMAITYVILLNLFALPLIFVLRFNYNLYKAQKLSL
jgi:hypothetical protein